jgi:hypothetical protein
MTHAVSRQLTSRNWRLDSAAKAAPRQVSRLGRPPVHHCVTLIRKPVLSKEAYFQERGTLVISHQEKMHLVQDFVHLGTDPLIPMILLHSRIASNLNNFKMTF